MGINKPPREDTTEAACSLNITTTGELITKDFKMELLSRLLLRRHTSVWCSSSSLMNSEVSCLSCIIQQVFRAKFFIFMPKNRLRSAEKIHLLVATIALQKRLLKAVRHFWVKFLLHFQTTIKSVLGPWSFNTFITKILNRKKSVHQCVKNAFLMQYKTSSGSSEYSAQDLKEVRTRIPNRWA